MKRVPAGIWWTLCAASWAPTPALSQPIPTRMQFCQRELLGTEGEERKRLLRDCLVRRADSERLVANECRRQAREVRAAPAERLKLQRGCEGRALAVHSSELPRRVVAAPRRAPEADSPAAAAEPALMQTSVTVPAPAQAAP